MKVNSLTDLNYTYDAAGNAGSVTDSSALFANQGGQTTYTYGAMNELKTITNQSTSGSSGITAKCVTMSYNADGSLDEITPYNGATPAARRSPRRNTAPPPAARVRLRRNGPHNGHAAGLRFAHPRRFPTPGNTIRQAT